MALQIKKGFSEFEIFPENIASAKMTVLYISLTEVRIVLCTTCTITQGNCQLEVMASYILTLDVTEIK